MKSQHEIEQVLLEILDTPDKVSVSYLATILANLFNGQWTATELKANLSERKEVLDLLQRLAGKSAHFSDASLYFGSENSIGDVTIRDFAGGHIIHAYINNRSSPDIFQFMEEYASLYIRQFVSVLTLPFSFNTAPRTLPNSHNFFFIAISLMIGFALFYFPAGNFTLSGIFVASVGSLCFWLFYSLVVYLILVLNGRPDFLNLVAINLKLLPVIYIIGNFAGLIWRGLGLSSIVPPMVVYYLIQFSMMSIYLPIALKVWRPSEVISQFLITVAVALLSLLGLSLSRGFPGFPPLLSSNRTTTPTSEGRTPTITLGPTITVTPPLTVTPTHTVVATETPRPTILCVSGSDSFLNSAAIKEIELAFERSRNNNVDVIIRPIGSEAATNELLPNRTPIPRSDYGCVDVLIRSEPLNEGQLDAYQQHAIFFECATWLSFDIIAFITAPDNAIPEVNLSQLKAILNGDITNWIDVAGDNRDINVIVRRGSGTTTHVFTTIAEFVPFVTIPSEAYPPRVRETECGTNDDCIQLVNTTSGSLHFVSVAQLPGQNVRIISIRNREGVLVNPLQGAIRQTQYPVELLRPVYGYVVNHNTSSSKKISLAKDFLNFILNNGQTDLEVAGFIPRDTQPLIELVILPPDFSVASVCR